MKVMPIGMVATLIAILIVTIIFAMMHPGGSGIAEGALLGVLISIFVVCGFVLHNYVNLNFGLKLVLGQAVVYCVQWTIVGIVIGLFVSHSFHNVKPWERSVCLRFSNGSVNRRCIPLVERNRIGAGLQLHRLSPNQGLIVESR